MRRQMDELNARAEKHRGIVNDLTEAQMLRLQGETFCARDTEYHAYIKKADGAETI